MTLEEKTKIEIEKECKIRIENVLSSDTKKQATIHSNIFFINNHNDDNKKTTVFLENKYFLLKDSLVKNSKGLCTLVKDTEIKPHSDLSVEVIDENLTLFTSRNTIFNGDIKLKDESTQTVSLIAAELLKYHFDDKIEFTMANQKYVIPEQKNEFVYEMFNKDMNINEMKSEFIFKFGKKDANKDPIQRVKMFYIVNQEEFFKAEKKEFKKEFKNTFEVTIKEEGGMAIIAAESEGIEVVEEEEETTQIGMGKGAIIGIVIGVVLVVIIFGILGYVLFFRKEAERQEYIKI